MPFWRIKWEFNQSVMGAGETYVSRSAMTPTEITDALGLFCNKRANIMWDNQFTVGLRVTDIGDNPLISIPKRRSVFLIPGDRKVPGGPYAFNIPSQGQRKVLTGSDKWPDQLRSALHLRCTLGRGNQTIRYLAGIPDSWSFTEPQTLKTAGDPEYLGFLNDFILHLQQMWGVMARTNEVDDPPHEIKEWVNEGSAPTKLGFKVLASEPGVINQGDWVKITGTRMKKTMRATLNGRWKAGRVVDPSGGDTFRTIWLNGSESINAADIKIHGTAQRIRYKPDFFTQIEPYRVGTHKRGRPSHAPRGRRTTRILLDP